MLSPVLVNYASSSGLSTEEVEVLWSLSKEITKSNTSRKDGDFYLRSYTVLGNLISLSDTKHKRKKIGKHSGKSWWNGLTTEQQREYLQEHPGSSANPKFKLRVSKRKPGTAKRKEEPKPQVPAEDVGEQSLERETKKVKSKERELIHKQVARGLPKLTHNAKQKPHVFTHGLKALKKLGSKEPLSKEDKAHLHTLAKVVMGAMLVAAVAFTPMVPFAGSLAHMYVDHIISKGPKEREQEEDGDWEPTEIDTPQIDTMSARESKDVYLLSGDMANWVLDQDQEQLLNDAKQHSRNT